VTRIPPHERPEIERPDDVDDKAVLSVFRVPKELAGMRADVFLSTQLRNTSRTRAKIIVRAAARFLDGSRIKPNTRLAPEQYIALWRPAWDETEIPFDIPILFQDEHLLVIDKPAGLPVHPSARYYRNTVIKKLGERFPSEHLVLGHRLDRDTSGVLVLARTIEADRLLKKQFRNVLGVEKSYQAITWNTPPYPQQRIELPLERNPESRLRCTMRVAAPGTGLKAATRIGIIKRYRRGDRRYSLVRCDLETGRQHQIRVHLASLGCPVVGDKIYGPSEELHARSSDGTLTDDDRLQLELPRHALHAWRMAFMHPMTDDRLVFEAPLPEDMQAFVRGLEVDDTL
jgi:23S rRNA pseudouridine1911/1915/1917 synthase